MARKSNKALNTEENVLESNENAIFNKETEGLSQSQIILKRFVRHRAAMVALFFFTTLVVIVYTALDWRIGDPRNPRFTIPGWWRYGFEDITDLTSEGCPEGTLGCPTIDFVPLVDGDGIQLGQHPFGQDNIGRDYFALVMRGAQRSILVMFIIGLIATTVGTIIGALAGFFRGWTDAVLMRLVDFIITIPVIIIGSVIGFHFGNKGAAFLALLLGLFSWTGLSRLVRGEFLSLREREFVDAARVAGATNRR
ncbi:MAG: ABC transporter permease subunit, partial [Actinobacteria bacterium]|nr:ABC transporter permease subunit [Actinomycetota bacterium]